MGIKLDKEKNDISKTRNSETEISCKTSKVKVFVIPTDEERVFVEDVVGLKSLAERAYNMAIKGLPISVPPVHEGERPRLDLPYDPELITWLRHGYSNVGL